MKGRKATKGSQGLEVLNDRRANERGCAFGARPLVLFCDSIEEPGERMYSAPLEVLLVGYSEGTRGSGGNREI
jgi:hypothetical protein